MFELSPHIDKNKIFLVNLSEIEGRLDPHPYHLERINTLKKLSFLPNIKKLKNVVTSKKRTTNNISPTDTYIGLENIESNTGVYIPTKEKKDISSANIFFKGQILFPKLRPYLNKVYLAEFNGLCSTEFHIFTSKLVKPEYLAIYLRSNLIVSQTKHLMTGNTLPRLQTEDIDNLPVPILSEEKQQQIIDLYETAYQTKQQKEKEAERLLNSIDDYLLDELGITLPEIDNSLNNRIFKVGFSEITSNRWNTYYYKKFYKENLNNIRSGQYNTSYLKSIIENKLIKGRLPINEEKNGENKVIQINSIDKYGNFDLNNLLTAKNIFTEEQKLLKNDILIVITGATIGKIAFWDNEGTYFLGGDLVKFQTKNAINPYYVFSLLQTKPLQIEIERNITGATNGHLSPKDIENIPIPLPPLEKQNEIAEYIKTIREQAKQLKLEAKQVLEQAKIEVEKMILQT